MGARHGHRTPPAARGSTGIHWRFTLERTLVRLGLAEPTGRTASEVDAHRRITRVALAAKRARALRDGGGSPRRLRRALARLDKALDQAIEHTGLARDQLMQAALLDEVTTLYGGTGLMDLPGIAPWEHLDHPAVTGMVRNSEAVLVAAALDRHTEAVQQARVMPEQVAEPVASGDRSATADATGRDQAADPSGDRQPLPIEGLVEESWRSRLLPWTRPVADDPDDRDDGVDATARDRSRTGKSQLTWTGAGPSGSTCAPPRSSTRPPSGPSPTGPDFPKPGRSAASRKAGRR